MNEKLLIINGDDFGQSSAVNHGVIKAHEQGVLTSTSLMVTGSEVSDAITLAKKCTELDVGLHLTLTETTPILQAGHVGTLIDKNGKFFKSYLGLFRKISFGGVDLKEVRAEWSAQIERFLEAGFTPTHIDSHYHVHLFPPLLDILIDLVRKYNFHWMRLPFETGSPSLRWFLMAPFALLAKQKLRANGIKTSRNFIGFANSGKMGLETLLNSIARQDDGVTELMVHPGLNDEPDIRYYRLQELNALLSDEIKGALVRNRVALVSFRQLG